MLLQASGQHAEGSNELVCPTGSEPSHIPSALEVLLEGLASAYILSPLLGTRFQGCPSCQLLQSPSHTASCALSDSAQAPPWGWLLVIPHALDRELYPWENMEQGFMTKSTTNRAVRQMGI